MLSNVNRRQQWRRGTTCVGCYEQPTAVVYTLAACVLDLEGLQTCFNDTKFTVPSSQPRCANCSAMRARRCRRRAFPSAAVHCDDCPNALPVRCACWQLQALEGNVRGTVPPASGEPPLAPQGARCSHHGGTGCQRALALRLHLIDRRGRRAALAGWGRPTLGRRGGHQQEGSPLNMLAPR